MNKKLKVVRYSDVKPAPKVGHMAYVFPVDHPGEDVSNTTWAITSPVRAVRIRDDLSIEFDTMNTRYVPA